MSTQEADAAFQTEVEILRNPITCLTKLLDTISLYKAEFSKLITKDDAKLSSSTAAFFKNETNIQWKVYPSKNQINTVYAGHQLRYMKGLDPLQANTFFKHLENESFSTEMRADGVLKSIIVDLTPSK